MTAIGRCRALLRFACASVALSCSGGLASSSTDGLPELVPERAGAGTSSAAVWKEAMDSLGEQLVKNLRGVPVQNAIKLAIFDVTSPQGGLCALGLTIEEELTTRLFRSKRFDIVERRQLSTVMAEQRMSTSESLDPRQAAKLGRLLGAQAVLAGTAVNVSEGFRVLPKIVLVETAQIISVAEANVPAIVAEKYGGCERVPRTDGWRSATETRDNGFTEDFRRTGIGGVPDGWLGAEHYGVKEDVRGRRYFTCRDSGPARFTIPVRDVPDDYRVEVAF
ncbi:MAG TPA: FlgO family outer membrane protein, partial [Polyangiaceae bacterium]|nr:FlgO family outer membrane protein [Polyangiaceae bacterium]